ncbi:hypothetical protein H4W00_001910 [Psychrobacter sp. PL19]|jgi:hypothetical protein
MLLVSKHKLTGHLLTFKLYFNKLIIEKYLAVEESDNPLAKNNAMTLTCVPQGDLAL